MDELAADLRRWLDNQPVLAAQTGARERARLWLRRNRLLAASVAAVSLALIGGAAPCRCGRRAKRAAKAHGHANRCSSSPIPWVPLRRSRR
ncbi:MAG: hypothetical protein WDO12_06705 [Pseudomonadota bacterium]